MKGIKLKFRQIEGFLFNWIYGGCHCKRCNRRNALIGGEAHITIYGEGSGCFPLCEACFHDLTINERLPYYRSLVDLWEKTSPKVDPYGNPISSDYKKEWALIEAAVLSGL